MVTVIRVTPSEAAAALTATESWSTSSVAADSIIQQANEITPHSTNGNNDENGGGKKRALPSEDIISGKDTTSKRQRTERFIIDLSDVPPQQPIPKKGHIKEGASKYTGVSFDKVSSKWRADINIEGKSRYLGHYENEEEAAIDYARALFKYRGQDVLDKARARGRNISGPTRKQKQSSAVIDLTDVPPQPPILKRKGYIVKEGSSKYMGVSLNKSTNKWQTQITIEGKLRHIGLYESEEKAAIDYARAVFKYSVGNLDKAGKRNSSTISIDLADVPPQLPIPKRGCFIKEGEGKSKYTGVSLIRANSKWLAQITIDGKKRYIGSYESEEEAAIDYARAVFKYNGEEALAKLREQCT